MSENDRKWYALVVKHQGERRTAAALETLGVETLVPLYRSRRHWSDRVKELDLPLFAGYVLCRFAYAERIRISDTPGVSRVVGFGGRAAPIEDSEVAAIQAVLRSKLPVRPWP
jgi:transcription antitermination factor NusG